MNAEELALALARARGGRSLREASEILGVAHNTVRFWEEGMVKPGPEHADAIARYLDVPVARVLRALGIIPERLALLYEEAERPPKSRAHYGKSSKKKRASKKASGGDDSASSTGTGYYAHKPVDQQLCKSA